MKGYYSFFLFLVAVCYSCTSGSSREVDKISSPNLNTDSIIENSSSNSEWKFDSLSLVKKIHVDNDTAKPGIEYTILMQYPSLTPSDIDIEIVQKTLWKIFIGEKSQASPPQQAFDEMTRQILSDASLYLEDFKDNPTFNIDYEINIGDLTWLASKDILIGSVASYAYTGGAHGNSEIRYYNIEVRTGKLITEVELFKNNYKDKLNLLIQNKVKSMNESTDEDQHLYLLVDLSEVQSNDNFYFSKEGLVYVYNRYEITPYVQGAPEIILSYDDILPLIKDEYKHVVSNLITK